jgi:hypothetical protein
MVYKDEAIISKERNVFLKLKAHMFFFFAITESTYVKLMSRKK